MQTLSLTLVFILGLALVGQAQSIEVSKKRVIFTKGFCTTATKKQSYKRERQVFYFKRLQPDGTYTYRKVEGFGRTVEDIDATKSESIGDDPIAECALLQMPGGSTVLLHPHLAHSEANLPSCHSHLRLIVTYSSEDQLERWIWPNSCLRDPPSHPFFVSISLLLLQLSFFLLFSLLLSLISDGVLLHVERITAVF